MSQLGRRSDEVREQNEPRLVLVFSRSKSRDAIEPLAGVGREVGGVSQIAVHPDIPVQRLPDGIRQVVFELDLISRPGCCRPGERGGLERRGGENHLPDKNRRWI